MPTPTDKRVIQIADDIFKNLEMRRGDVVTKYSKLFQITERRVDSLYAEAKEYNIERLNKAEKAKDRVLIQKETEGIESALNRREKLMANLWRIAMGEPQEIVVDKDEKGNPVKKLIVVKPNDQIAATREILEVEGWKAPIKTENTINLPGMAKTVDQMTDEELKTFLKAKSMDELRLS